MNAIDSSETVTAAPQPPAARRSPTSAPRANKKKPRHAGECETLEQLPNIGPALARDLRSIGVGHPGELAAQDGYSLYRALCEKTGKRQDPCVLDTFLAVTDFMRGAPPAPWWTYTSRRKREFGPV